MTSSSVWAQAIAARQAFQTLVNEAGVVVADEGHQIKNPATKRFAAVTSLKTKRRIALTGYPLQNNMDEYYTMIMWCMDDLLGDAAYFHDTFSKPIQEGEIAKCIYLCISCCATIIPTASDTSLAVSMGNQFCIMSSSRSISIMPCSGWTMEGLQGYPAQHTCCMPVIHSVQCALRSTCSESSKYDMRMQQQYQLLYIALSKPVSSLQPVAHVQVKWQEHPCSKCSTCISS